MGQRLAHSAALSMAKTASRIAGGSVGQASITWTSSGSSGQFLDGNGPLNRHSNPGCHDTRKRGLVGLFRGFARHVGVVISRCHTVVSAAF
jgi:hypothetical protein